MAYSMQISPEASPSHPQTSVDHSSAWQCGGPAPSPTLHVAWYKHGLHISQPTHNPSVQAGKNAVTLYRQTSSLITSGS